MTLSSPCQRASVRQSPLREQASRPGPRQATGTVTARQVAEAIRETVKDYYDRSSSDKAQKGRRFFPCLSPGELCGNMQALSVFTLSGGAGRAGPIFFPSTVQLLQLGGQLFRILVGDGAKKFVEPEGGALRLCLLYTSPSPRDRTRSRMPSSA